MFQLHGTSCKLWAAPEESGPEAMMRSTRKCVGYFGAARVSDGTFLASICEGRFNAETTFQSFRKLQEFDRGRKKVVIIDNVGYHHAVLFKNWLEEA